MQLHGVFAPELPNEYSLLVEAAKDMANVVRTFGNLTIRTAPFFAAVCPTNQKHLAFVLTYTPFSASLDNGSRRIATRDPAADPGWAGHVFHSK